MEQVKLVVLIPVGPNCHLDYVYDTLESVWYFTTPSKKVVILDDSQKGTGKNLLDSFPDLVVLKAPKNYGKRAGLYLNLSKGFEFSYENYDFEVMLRLDTDALIIGHNPEEDAIKYFHQNPEIGIIGSYRMACHGKIRNFSLVRKQLEGETNWISLLMQPWHLQCFLFLRKILKISEGNGYERGEHCLGGAYFISKKCISQLYQNNLLSRQEIRWSRLQEDQIFGLFIYSLGLKHGDFSTNSLPMCLKWRGLPYSPEQLVARRKKVIHSTKFYNDMNEAQIRAFFKKQRQ